MECGSCCDLYHIKCGRIDEMHYLLFANNNLRESGFSWSCEGCKEKRNDCDVQVCNNNNEELENMKKDVAEIKSFFPEMIKLLKLSTENTAENVHTMEADIKHSLLVQPKDTAQKSFTNQAWAEVVKTSLTTKLNNVPVKKAVLTSSGMGYMLFPDKNTRDEAAKNLEEDCTVTVHDKNIKTVYPKLKISGIPKECFNKDNIDELRNELINKNSFVKSLIDMDKIFDILFIVENKDSNFSSAIVKVDPSIKEAILSHGSRVFLGLSSCRVTERYHIIQCYSCQQFGHKKDSTKCPLKNSSDCVCLYCADNHQSRNCPVKKNVDMHKCSNCMKSKNENIKSNCTGHTSNSFSCPLLKTELKALLSRTMGNTGDGQVAKNAITT